MPDSPAATKAAEDWGAPIPELVELGERLASARRDQGLTLEDLAGRLRLGTEQLMALESGDHAHLPEAVFVVAQAKRVAGALGIDVSQQISHLQGSRMMRQGRQRATAPQRPRPVIAPARPGASGSARRSGLNPGWLGLALLLVGGGTLAVAAAQGKLPFLPAPGSASVARPAGRPATPAPVAAAPASPAPDELLLQSRQPSWLEVRDGAGVTLFRGTFTGEKRFPLGQGLKLLAGRPDLVTATTGNQPPRPLGRIDQVVWRTFTPTPAAP